MHKLDDQLGELNERTVTREEFEEIIERIKSIQERGRSIVQEAIADGQAEPMNTGIGLLVAFTYLGIQPLTISPLSRRRKSASKYLQDHTDDLTVRSMCEEVGIHYRDLTLWSEKRNS